jgi:hypothetical protein
MSDGLSSSSLAWWNARRLRYNISLVFSGVLAFIAYVVVVTVLEADVEITLFTIVFQGAGYLIMMGVANVCYFLGPLSERILQPKDLPEYRQNCYRLGFWFSVLLPFSIPVLWIVVAIFHSPRSSSWN